MTSKLIYFVRHGESELNAEGIRQGPDGSLSEKGVVQVMTTAKRFPKEKGRPQVIIASPFQRTQETADIIGKELKMPVEYSDLLVERKNPSEIVGHKGDEKDVRKIVDVIDKSYHDDSLRFSDEENFVDLKNRARNLLYYITERPEERLIMVTHGIFLKMVVAYMIYGEKLNASLYNTVSYVNKMDNAGMTICQFVPHWFKADEWKVITWNDLV